MGRTALAGLRIAFLGFAISLAISLASAPALSAEPPPARNPAAAEDLFKQALEAEDKGEWQRACSLYEASFKLDPSVGTELNIGRCAEHFGKIATAWAEFQKTRVLNRETPGDQRRVQIEKFLDEADARLKDRLPYVLIDVRPRPAGLIVTSDGAPLPLETMGVQIPIDPGKHELVFSAPGFLDEHRTLEVGEGKKAELIVELRAAPPEKPKVIEKPAIVTPERSSTQLIAGIVIASVGGLTLVGSAITGGLAQAKRGALDDLVAASGGSCHEDTNAGTLQCGTSGEHDQALDLSDQGQTLAGASTGLLFAGAAISVTGIIVAVTGLAPSKPRAASLRVLPIASPRGGALIVGGAF